MALKNPSLFLYGFTVTALNSSIDFQNASAGPILMATVQQGNYSLSSLMTAIVVALQAADPANTYTCTADRTVAGGTQNRVTIATTTGTYFSILFSSGPRHASAIAPLIGFNAADYTGFLTYEGSTTAGTTLIPNFTGFQYLGPDFMQKNFGQVNVSASGIKEAITFAVQYFFQVQFKYIPEATWEDVWTPLMAWLIQQNEVDFTPDITAPTTFYESTLESSPGDGKGLAFQAREMLSEGFPFLYDSGLMKFRLVNETTQFIVGE